MVRKQNTLHGRGKIITLNLEQVQSHKYLGSTVNIDNSIEEEIQSRITFGNNHTMPISLFLNVYWSPRN